VPIAVTYQPVSGLSGSACLPSWPSRNFTGADHPRGLAMSGLNET
jgi:hypothetical protein